MKDFLTQLTSYNLLNHLFPGAIFCILGDKFTGLPLVQENLVSAFFFYYFVGLVLSRIGSLVVEPIVKSRTVTQNSNYPKFVAAVTKDPKIDLLVEINTLYRTLIAFPFVLALLKIYTTWSSIEPWVQTLGPYLLGLLLSVIFFFSYKKQSKYISDRVDANS